MNYPETQILQQESFYEEMMHELVHANQLHEDALFVVNRAEVRNRYKLIQELLPACKHYFAIKSCPQKAVIEEIKLLGGCFDVASSGEIKLLQENDVHMDDCIHTHPIKKQAEITKALEAGIQVFVIDNENELAKFEPHKKQVKLMLRLAFSNQDATIDLSSKFGIEPSEALAFIIRAVMQGYCIDGLCFHVGSQMPTNVHYLNAMDVCCELFNEAAQIGIQLNTLDIGGGFPFYANQSIESLHAFFQPIQHYLETYFQGINCIAEPGRFVSSSVATLVCKVIGKSSKNLMKNYYLNDGVYGCLSNKIFDFYNMDSCTILSTCEDSDMKFNSTIYGPTCDSIDVILKNTQLPELFVDDIILFKNIGAYSIASTTDFNLLGITKVVDLDIA